MSAIIRQVMASCNIVFSLNPKPEIFTAIDTSKHLSLPVIIPSQRASDIECSMETPWRNPRLREELFQDEGGSRDKHGDYRQRTDGVHSALPRETLTRLIIKYSQVPRRVGCTGGNRHVTLVNRSMDVNSLLCDNRNFDSPRSANIVNAWDVAPRIREGSLTGVFPWIDA